MSTSPFSLARMTVANLEQRARRVHRNEQRRSRDKFLVIQIARMNPRRRAADAARCFWWRDAHASEKRPQGYFDVVREPGHHTTLIERDDLHARVRKFIGQETRAGAESVVGVRNFEANGLDPNFEHIARLGAFHVHRPGENVADGPFVGDLSINAAQRRLDLFGRQSGSSQSRRTVGDHGFDFDRVA